MDAPHHVQIDAHSEDSGGKKKRTMIARRMSLKQGINDVNNYYTIKLVPYQISQHNHKFIVEFCTW
jgi:hypothetical protein